jgi:hypothetical protein
MAKNMELPSNVTWREWKRRGGCGLSRISEHMVCQTLKVPHGDLSRYTLKEIADAWPAAKRELTRWAETRMPKKFRELMR